MPLHSPGPRRGSLVGRLSLLLGSSALAIFGASGIPTASASTTHAAAHAASNGVVPSGDSGTAVDPLQYNCEAGGPTCGNVGETQGWYNGQTVSFLYTGGPYADPAESVPGHAPVEVGHPGTTATIPGITTAPPGFTAGTPQTAGAGSAQIAPLYIPIPLYTGSTSIPPQCGTAGCIDHPATVDLSAVSGALGLPGPASNYYNYPFPSHDHIITTRAGSLPIWWQVIAVAVKSQADFNAIESAKSYAAVQALETSDPNNVIEAATNGYLQFQVLDGQVAPALAGAEVPAAPPVGSPAANDNLRNDCQAGGPLCDNIGISHAWYNGADVNFLYTEQYYCDPTITSGSSSHCEAGAKGSYVPPGAVGPNDSAPPGTSASGIDPLYIPVPLYATPTPYLQCSANTTCIDHPSTIDLSRLGTAVPSLATDLNGGLPGHDHLITTDNATAGVPQPEWWDVQVLGVTTAAAMADIQTAKSYTAATVQADIAAGTITAPIPTNVDLWFSVIKSNTVTPGPTQATVAGTSTIPNTCSTKLPSGTVTASAALADGSGYIESDAKGDVSVFGTQGCYGSLTGLALNQPIVGAAADQASGGYYLVAADGGIFAFNAPYYGSEGGVRLNKPMVGITAKTDGSGYETVASDGGLFAFGNEQFYGSTGGLALNKPVVGMAQDQATGGYWLVAADGGVFAYHAPFLGSTGSIRLNKPVVALSPTFDSSGYRFFASDGGVFAYNAPFYGSLGSTAINKPVIGGGTNPGTDGYWMFASDGGVFAYNTPFYGSAA